MKMPNFTRKSGAQSAAVQSLRAIRSRGSVAAAFGLRRFERRFALAVLLFTFTAAAAEKSFYVLKPEVFAHHIERFNAMEDENVTNTIPNAGAWDWLQGNVPLFECSDREVTEMYDFRWWSFRKHLVQTTNGFVFTEFLTPVRHAGPFNTISCAAGFHVMEGRWLRGGS